MYLGLKGRKALVTRGVWAMAEQMGPDRFAAALARQPLGRMGRPEEVAAAVAFLASPRSGFTTGSNLICDGGASQRVDF